MNDLKPYTGKGHDGWTVLQSMDCMGLRHDKSKRVFTLRKVDDISDYWDVYACSPHIDNPKGVGDRIMRIQGLRKALLAIGFLKSNSMRPY